MARTLMGEWKSSNGWRKGSSVAMAAFTRLASAMEKSQTKLPSTP